MNYLVKLTDNGSNTINFGVDSYEEIDANNDINSRTQSGDMHHYAKTDKKKFVMSVRNMNASTKDDLKTLWNTHSLYDFYREADGASTAEVIWEEDFNLHTPTNESRQFIDLIYQGQIVLKEV